jgi:hypothetical protein
MILLYIGTYLYIMFPNLCQVLSKQVHTWKVVIFLPTLLFCFVKYFVYYKVLYKHSHKVINFIFMKLCNNIQFTPYLKETCMKNYAKGISSAYPLFYHILSCISESKWNMNDMNSI